jgi:hypothetical protein
VCGLNSARLLLFSGPIGPGYRKGDAGLVSRAGAAQLFRHERDHERPGDQSHLAAHSSSEVRANKCLLDAVGPGPWQAPSLPLVRG